MNEAEFNEFLDRLNPARVERRQFRVKKKKKEALAETAETPPEPTEPPEPLDPRRPPWVPRGANLQKVPPEIVHAIEEFIVPIYQQLVVDAAHPLERSMGISLVHALWLEALQQQDFLNDYTGLDRMFNLNSGAGGMLPDQMRLIHTKIRANEHLFNLRRLIEAREAAHARGAGIPGFPTAGLPASGRPPHTFLSDPEAQDGGEEPESGKTEIR